MIFTPYDQWLETELKHRRESTDKTECPACRGMGSKDCGECGHETDCDECETSGEVRYCDLNDAQLRGTLTREVYEQAVLNDAEALGGWLGREPSTILVASGFRPWVSLIYQMTAGEVTGFRAGTKHAL